MHISGDGFTGFNVKVKPNFKPDTRLALKWEQLANGNYIVIDRSQSNDIYETDVSIYGKEEEIDAFIEAIQMNRHSGTNRSNILLLSEFNESEKLFGAEILYSGDPVSAVVVELKEKEQSTWRGYGLRLTLRALFDESIPTDETIVAAFPDTEKALVQIGYTGDSNVDLEMTDSYSGSPFFIDGNADTGFFEGEFTLNTREMAKLRLFLIRNRGGVIRSDSDAGRIINNLRGIQERLFGKRREYAGPFDVRITEWKDMGMDGLLFWNIKMKIVEEV
jgi:hypothetical protein